MLAYCTFLHSSEVAILDSHCENNKTSSEGQNAFLVIVGGQGRPWSGVTCGLPVSILSHYCYFGPQFPLLANGYTFPAPGQWRKAEDRKVVWFTHKSRLGLKCLRSWFSLVDFSGPPWLGTHSCLSLKTKFRIPWGLVGLILFLERLHFVPFAVAAGGGQSSVIGLPALCSPELASVDLVRAN